MGEITKNIVCHSCKESNIIKEPFLELQVDIQENTSLKKCIENMLKGEEFKDDCKFDCNFCKKRSDATSK